MKRTYLSIMSMSAAITLAACAAQPSAPEPVPAPPAVETAPVVLASAAPAPATMPTPAAQSDIIAMLKKRGEQKQRDTAASRTHAISTRRREFHDAAGARQTRAMCPPQVLAAVTFSRAARRASRTPRNPVQR